MGIKFKHLPGLYHFFKMNKKAGKILAVVLAVLGLIIAALLFLAFNLIAGLLGSIGQNFPSLSGLLGMVPENWSQIGPLAMGVLDWLNGIISKYGSLLDLLNNL